jgi:regulator of protease activity HflC (stomatin/prohibitin superfamily)
MKHPSARVFGAVPLLALALLSGCTQQVPPASVGVKFDAESGISEKMIKPQVVWVKPHERLIVYPTSIRNASYLHSATEGEKQGEDSIKASTLEGATLPVDVTVAYHVAPERVLDAFQNFGTADLATIQREHIRWVTNYAVNVVSGQRSIFALTSTERATFGGEVKSVLAPILDHWGITVDNVYIGEVYPQSEVAQKVQERLATRNDLELAREARKRAETDAKTTLINAQKEAEQNRLLAAQGEKTIELKRIELRRAAIAKWDGRPPLVGNGQIPFTGMAAK